MKQTVITDFCKETIQCNGTLKEEKHGNTTKDTNSINGMGCVPKIHNSNTTKLTATLL